MQKYNNYFWHNSGATPFLPEVQYETPNKDRERRMGGEGGSNLQTGVAMVSLEHPDDPNVPLADSNMEWGLPPPVAGIEVNTLHRQHLNNTRLITKTSMMDW